MNSIHKSRFLTLAACSALTCGAGSTWADDTEIFVGQPTNAVAPNIMFVLDTSGSMSSNVNTMVEYDPSQTYTGTGSCADAGDYVYFTTGSSPPSCNSSNRFLRSQLKCANALTSVALGAGGTGRYFGTFARWGGNSNNRGWRSNNLSPSNAADVECSADAGLDGNLDGLQHWPTNQTSSSATGVWTANSANSYWNSNTGYAATLYTGNYITYWNQHRTVTIGTRMAIMKQAATDLLNSLSGVNVGLMRYSRNNGDGDLLARGGMVAYPVGPIESNRSALVAAVDSYTANGFTPLSETLFEAYRYFSGGQVLYGDISVPFKSVAASRTPADLTSTTYDSPADYSCQKNYVVYLTDGLPTADSEANALITGLPNFATLGGTCDASGSGPDSSWPDSGLCLTALSRYMYSADLRTDVAGQQNVQAYWVGFGNDVAGGTPFQFIQRAAVAGGGQALTAEDATGLTAALTSIVTSILQTSTSFAAPTVAVNAFNRTQSLNDLYVSVFRPAGDRHWPGNVKKYRVERRQDGAVIVDSNGNLAIDQDTGFFRDSSRSYWSDVTDGITVTAGGAANEIPIPGNRNVYTFIGANPGSPATLSGNSNYAVSTSNTQLTSAVLGLGATGDPTLTQLVDWMRGQDVRDDDADGDTTEPRRTMGDPIHAQPGVVIYGGTTASPNIDDAVAFVPTNDGYLHAISVTSGEELWAFIPQQALPQMKELYFNNPTSTKQYLLDGEVRVLKYDLNGDGIVDSNAGDRVLLYFGQGRGGSNYYALDVTSKTSPKFMWSIGPSVLTGIGEAWSTPVVARVNVAGATQNSQKLVLIMGGGYDSVENNGPFVAADTSGNRLYMIDALRGTLLWSAGQSGANLNLTRMTHAIPATPAVLDTNSDGYADRIYVGDMAAQLWRFDITNGNNAANLVAGGVLASLGTKDDASPILANTRRFYNTPDVAAIQRTGLSTYFNIAIGSGYRGHPLSTTTQERFYSIRDYRPFGTMTQAQYDALTVIRDSDITDITLNMAPALANNANGWKLSLNQPGNAWRGEKSLGRATTAADAIIFTTYTPGMGSSSSPCQPSTGSNRAYAVNVADGSPVRISGEAGPEDRYEEFTYGGIASDVSTLFLTEEPNQEPCEEGEECQEPPPRNVELVCLSGVKVLDICRDFGTRFKTYWRESSTY